jgi:hypothetical protein
MSDFVGTELPAVWPDEEDQAWVLFELAAAYIDVLEESKRKKLCKFAETLRSGLFLLIC